MERRTTKMQLGPGPAATGRGDSRDKLLVLLLICLTLLPVVQAAVIFNSSESVEFNVSQAQVGLFNGTGLVLNENSLYRFFQTSACSGNQFITKINPDGTYACTTASTGTDDQNLSEVLVQGNVANTTLNLGGNSVIDATSFEFHGTDLAGVSHVADDYTGGDGFIFLTNTTGAETRALRLYMEDNADESFQIWGDSCAGGDCMNVTASQKNFQFEADGDMSIYRGVLDMNGNRLTNIGSNNAYFEADSDLQMAGQAIRSVDWVAASGGLGIDLAGNSINTNSGTVVEIHDSANAQAIATFNEGGNVEIPNGGLDVNGGDVYAAGRSMDPGKTVTFDSAPARMGYLTDSGDSSIRHTIIDGDEGVMFTTDWQNNSHAIITNTGLGVGLGTVGSTAEPVQPDATLDVGGTLDMNGNDITFDTSSSSIAISGSQGQYFELKNDGYLGVVTDGSGSNSFGIWDAANNQGIATFNEGGNVDIPNGRLEVSSSSAEFRQSDPDFDSGDYFSTETAGSGSNGHELNWYHYDSSAPWKRHLLRLQQNGDAEIIDGNLHITDDAYGQSGDGNGGSLFMDGDWPVLEFNGTPSGDGGGGVRMAVDSNHKFYMVPNHNGSWQWNKELQYEPDVGYWEFGGQLGVGGDLNLEGLLYGPTDGSWFRIHTSGLGDDAIALYDRANNQPILRAYEGGEVRIPNGNLGMNSNEIRDMTWTRLADRDSDGNYMWSGVESGTNTWGIWDDELNGWTINSPEGSGNVNIPNGDLYTGGGHIREIDDLHFNGDTNELSALWLPDKADAQLSIANPGGTAVAQFRRYGGVRIPDGPLEMSIGNTYDLETYAFPLNSGSGAEYFKLGEFRMQSGEFKIEVIGADDPGGTHRRTVTVTGSVWRGDIAAEHTIMGQGEGQGIDVLLTETSTDANSDGYNDVYLYARADDYSHAKAKLEFVRGAGSEFTQDFQSGLSAGDLVGTTVFNSSEPASGAITVGSLELSSFPQTGSDTMCWDGSGTSNIGDCSSLRAFKENITDLSLGLETIRQLQPRMYRWIEEKGGKQDLGFVAEEIEQVDPLLADYNDGNLTGVKYRHMTALLTKGIQELVNRTAQLEQEKQVLQEKNKELERQLAHQDHRVQTVQRKNQELTQRIQDQSVQIAALTEAVCQTNPSVAACSR